MRPVRYAASSRGARLGALRPPGQPSPARRGCRTPPLVTAASTAAPRRRLAPPRAMPRRSAKGPVERGAQVVDLAPIIGQPFGGGARLQFGLGPLEQVAVIFGVAARDRFELTALAELFERISPRRVEQAVARYGGVGLGCDERFRDQAGEALDDF